ncbi:MAG: Gfo/Idh/MocA family oxidoreductase [Gemmatimonadetes bacterium]|jgi:predicted dehydrogenase|nr:Gfo/Idh/MocA family oxidoreductase [Gemmatimonadota bacterium]MBT6145332.1 Gfo/Idh/MocA family oxidoreductase [Gemmatimonadota bacterium]MBT7862622.1 Gfo/Idh/MocA family oxidoreductase [Gemmatimonadota bacterium]
MTLRAAVIGCGRMAGTIDDEITYDHPDFVLPYGHAPGYAATDGVELVAAADVDGEKLGAWCDRFDVPARFTDHQQLLAEIKPDIVSVTTPAHARATPLLDAIESGVRGIYAEKALCTSQADLDRIVSACEIHGTQIVYGAMRRYWAGFESAKAFLDAGHLGAPKSALIGASGGSAFHTHSHIIDAALYLLGDPDPVAVQATLRGREGELGIQTQEDGAIVTDSDPSIVHAFIELAGDLTLTCTSLPMLDIEIVCEEGVLRNWGDSSRYTAMRCNSRYDWEPVEVPSWQARSGTVAIIQDLMGAITDGRPTRSGLEVIRRGMEILFAMVASHAVGGRRVVPMTMRNVSVHSH